MWSARMRGQYKAAVLYGTEDVRVEMVPFTEVEPGHVMIRVVASNVCPTDLRKYRGHVKAPGPMILGHEVAGVVEEVGEEVESVKRGDRVAVMPIMVCGECRYCNAGKGYAQCDSIHAIAGSNGSITRSWMIYKEEGIGGGFAEYMKVRQHSVLKIPDSISFEEASFAEPLGCVIKSQGSHGTVEGTTVAVIGGGPMGNIHAQVAKAFGAGMVIVSEPLEARRRRAEEMGADVTIDPTTADPVKKVKELTDGRGADMVTVAAGGRAEAPLTEQAVRMAAKAARINIFAGTYPPTNITLDPNDVHYKELTVTGTTGYTPETFREGLSLVARGEVKVKPLREPVFTLDEIRKAFEVYGSPEAFKVGFDMGAK